MKISHEVTIDYIQQAVCDYFNMSVESLQSKTRKREIVQARQIAMYFSKDLTKLSLCSIGAKIGNKNHATVLHACKTVNNLIDTDKYFRIDMQEIEKKMKEDYKLSLKEIFLFGMGANKTNSTYSLAASLKVALILKYKLEDIEAYTMITSKKIKELTEQPFISEMAVNMKEELTKLYE